MKKILIVDDQSFIREVLKSELVKLLDVSILEAANGNEAMGKIKVSKPDLILLDIVMPSKDGFQVLQELNEDLDTRNIPVVIVSSHADDEKISKAKQYPCVKEFVDKMSLNQIDFVSLVNRYLGV